MNQLAHGKRGFEYGCWGFSMCGHHRPARLRRQTMNIVLDGEWCCKICDFGLTFTLESTHMTVRSLQARHAKFALRAPRA